MVSKSITVAEYIADFFIQKGIKYIFGFQGGAILKILHELIATGKVEYIQNYHEQASSFCADSYSRISQDIGVAIATSGPGATNLVTGIANAQLDSIPTLFITGQDYTQNVTRNNAARLNGFQDLDIVSVVKPITKYAIMLTNPQDVKYEFEKCYHMAKNGRPGAVLIDVPIDVQFAQVDVDSTKSFTPPREQPYHLDKTVEVINLLKSAKRPVVLAGGGIQIAKATPELEEFVKLSKIPVVTTLNGLDSVKHSYSFAGLHGNVYSNIIIRNADLILAIGARFGQRQVGKIPKNYTRAKIIHVDIDFEEFDRSIKSYINIFSDLKLFLNKLNKELRKTNIANYTDWSNTAKKWKNKYNDTAEINTEKLKPIMATKKIIDLLNDNSVITCDVGHNQMWVAQAFKKKGTMRLINSSGLGSMGYSIPAAIGAKYANPRAKIVSFTGDGGFHMNMQELLLIGQKQLNIKVVVFKNNTLGMMREVQARYYNSNYHGANPKEFVCVDLKKTADTFNLQFAKIEKEEQLESISDLINNNKPCIIELDIAFDSKLSNRYDESHIIEENILDE
ncbi:IlvB1: acetolactate synthase, large subunit [Desulfosarcina variabilis str. Montpellier]